MSYPILRVVKIHNLQGEIKVIGKFNFLKGVNEGFCYLQGDDGKFIHGKIISLSKWFKKATFIVAKEFSSTTPKEGCSYKYFDGYWGERAEIVLNENYKWSKKQYKQRGNWDHDHCSINWETIDENTNPVYYENNVSDMICENCYKKYIVKRDISFIPEQTPSGRSADNSRDVIPNRKGSKDRAQINKK
jgi:hypothetical protein